MKCVDQGQKNSWIPGTKLFSGPHHVKEAACKRLVQSLSMGAQFESSL